MLENKLIPTDEKVIEQLGLEKGAQVLYISRVRTANGEPVAIEKNYFPLKYSFLLEKRFDDNSLFECLRDEAKVKVAVSEKRIELCRATTSEAAKDFQRGTASVYKKCGIYAGKRTTVCRCSGV